MAGLEFYGLRDDLGSGTAMLERSGIGLGISCP